MMRYFARELLSGVKLSGVISKRDLLPYRRINDEADDDLSRTQPFAVQAAPGFSYMFVEIVTAGNILSPHIFVVHTKQKT